MFSDDCLDKCGSLFGIAHVGGMERDALREIIGGIAATDRNLASGFRQAQRDIAPQPTRPAGHDCDFTAQIEGNP